MEEEAEKLKELQNEVEKQMNLSPPPGECMREKNASHLSTAFAFELCFHIAQAGTWEQLGHTKFSCSSCNLDSFQEQNTAFILTCADINSSCHMIISRIMILSCKSI